MGEKIGRIDVRSRIESEVVKSGSRYILQEYARIQMLDGWVIWQGRSGFQDMTFNLGSLRFSHQGLVTFFPSSIVHHCLPSFHLVQFLFVLLVGCDTLDVQYNC